MTKDETKQLTVTFKRINNSLDILEGMEGSKQEMIKQGLWNELTTFEDWSNFAGRNVLLKEKSNVDS